MKKRLLLICGILILVAVIALEATNAMNKGSTNTEEVISKPNKMAEPAQSTAESALPEPVLQGRKVNMDDAMWEDAINELDEYIDQQIGGIKRIGSCAGSGAALFCVRREPEPGLLTYCPKVDTKIQKILLGATFRVVLTPLSRHGTIIKIICERVNCAMVSIREGLSCCDKTHGAVFLPHAVSGASF